MALLHRASLLGSLLVIIGLAAGMPLRDDIGNMSMAISTTVPDAQRYDTRRRERRLRAWLEEVVCCLLRENYVQIALLSPVVGESA